MTGKRAPAKPQLTIIDTPRTGYWPADRESDLLLLNGEERKKPRYLKFNQRTGAYSFDPAEDLKKVGFKYQSFGKELKLEDVLLVERLNEEWKSIAAGLVDRRKTNAVEARAAERLGYPEGSVGWVYNRFMKTRREAREANGLPLPKKNQDFFARGWESETGQRISRFAYWDFKEITDREELDLYKELLLKYKREAQRVTTAFRILRRYAASLGFAQAMPEGFVAFEMKGFVPRSAYWLADEIDKLIEGALKKGMPRLACLLSLAWDSKFSPTDVRNLTLRQIRPDPVSGRPYLDIARRKTGKQGVGFLTDRSVDLVLRTVPEGFPDDKPFLLTRGFDKRGKRLAPRPYQENVLDKDFRELRTFVFGKNEDRCLSDFRRSGALEEKNGGATNEQVAASLGNDFDKSAMLQRTYVPDELAAQLKAAAIAFESRQAGREFLKGAATTIEERGISLLRQKKDSA